MRTRTPLQCLLGLPLLLVGCKEERPPCEPDTVKWGVSLVIGAGTRVNPNDEGEALPTVVRVFQMRGELAAEDIDPEQVFEVEKAEELGEDFLAFDELLMAPSSSDLRTIPLKEEATHLMAAGLFRQTLGRTWYTLYEIPRQHADSVCARDPVGKDIPDPCFFVFADRSEVSGGEVPPPNFGAEGVQCAPLGPPPKVDKKKGRRLRRRKDIDEELEDPLRTKDIEEKTPDRPTLPDAPQAPKRPDAPGRGDLPSAPERPGLEP